MTGMKPRGPMLGVSVGVGYVAVDANDDQAADALGHYLHVRGTESYPDGIKCSAAIFIGAEHRQELVDHLASVRMDAEGTARQLAAWDEGVAAGGVPVAGVHTVVIPAPKSGMN